MTTRPAPTGPLRRWGLNQRPRPGGRCLNIWWGEILFIYYTWWNMHDTCDILNVKRGFGMIRVFGLCLEWEHQTSDGSIRNWALWGKTTTVNICEIGPYSVLQTGKWRLDDAVSLVVCSFWYKFEDFEVMAPLFMCFVLGSILFPPSLEFFLFCKCDLERDRSVLHWYQRTCTWFLKAESRQRQIALLLQRCLVASSSWDRAFRRRENVNKFERI